MSGQPVLNSLEIQRFRCFECLRIERLGRVNLVVGKNSVGKSTILEALRLFADPSTLEPLFQILVSRNEISRAEVDDWQRSPSGSLPLDNLFFKQMATTRKPIRIGPADSPDDSLELLLTEEDQIWNFVYPEEPRVAGEPAAVFTAHHRIRMLIYRIGSSARVFPVGATMHHGLPKSPGRDSMAALPGRYLDSAIRVFPSVLVEPNSLNPSLIGRLWDDVSLSPSEEEVVAALHIISPRVERIAMKGVRGPTNGSAHAAPEAARIPFVKLLDFEEPVPLRVLGDGVNRLFGIALALVGVRGGILLVDEIENGIHYSVQADLWRLIFRTAARLNVQVFATTYSYDCIRAFQEAARESDEDGMLIRLARKGDQTIVGEFDEPELEVAVEGEIEVR